MHGPYGVSVYFRNTTKRSDEEIEKEIVGLHPFIKSLPGFRSVMYFNVDELDYHVAISFEDEASTDNALHQFQNLTATRTDLKISKAEVVPGEVVDQIIVGGNFAR